MPSRIITSGKETPAASTLTSTSPGSGSGQSSSTTRSSSGPPYCVTTMRVFLTILFSDADDRRVPRNLRLSGQDQRAQRVGLEIRLSRGDARRDRVLAFPEPTTKRRAMLAKCGCLKADVVLHCPHPIPHPSEWARELASIADRGPSAP